MTLTAFVPAGAAAIVLWLGLTAASAGAARAVPCSPRAVQAALPSRGLHVAEVEASGVACTHAVVLAAQAAKALELGTPLSIPGVVGLSVVSTDSCSTCVEQSRVSLTLPGASVTLLVKGALKSSWLVPALPSLRVPDVPSPPFSGGGSGSTTV
jgi:hypothetical protein